MIIEEFPYNFGVPPRDMVFIWFHKKDLEPDYILTRTEFDGVKKILGKDYKKVSLDEFKMAYMAELI